MYTPPTSVFPLKEMAVLLLVGFSSALVLTGLFPYGTPTYSLTHPLTHSLTHHYSYTHTLTTHLLTHSLTHSLDAYMLQWHIWWWTSEQQITSTRYVP
jgi:hypothetical protein